MIKNQIKQPFKNEFKVKKEHQYGLKKFCKLSKNKILNKSL